MVDKLGMETEEYIAALKELNLALVNALRQCAVLLEELRFANMEDPEWEEMIKRVWEAVKIAESVERLKRRNGEKVH
ncbi:MAG: hypothetical protein JW821_00115 [Deltaproteobacteria bacterium]|nr:hypothetical protein [Deltaproteobacteria bacterium]